VPAVAVKRGGQALFIVIWCKVFVDGKKVVFFFKSKSLTFVAMYLKHFYFEYNRRLENFEGRGKIRRTLKEYQ